MICTLLTFENWKREIRYGLDPVPIASWVATISYPHLEESQIKEIEEATTEQVQFILSKL